MQPDDIPLLPFPVPSRVFVVPVSVLDLVFAFGWFRSIGPAVSVAALFFEIVCCSIARPWCLRLVFFLGPCLVIYLSIFEKLSNKQNDSGVGYDTYSSVHELINVF